MTKYKGELGLFLVAIMWGSGFVAAALGVEVMTALQIMFLRFLFALVVFALIFRKALISADKKTVICGAVNGTFLFLGFLAQTVGLVYTTASKNAFLTATNVVIVPFIGFVLFRRKLDIYGLIGAVTALLGIALLSLKDDLTMGIGDILTLVCAVFFALQIFFTGEFLKRGVNPDAFNVFQMGTACVLSLFGLIFTKEALTLFSAPPSGYLAVLYLAVFCTAIGFFLQTNCQAYTKETTAAIILSTESVFGTLFSVWLLHERLTPRMIAGCIMIFGAVIISELKPGIFKRKEATFATEDIEGEK